MVPPPVYQPYPTFAPEPSIEVFAVQPTASLGWKVFGLFERHNDRWRAKDLCGIYQLLHHLEHDPALVRDSIDAIFSWRDEPLTTLNRLLEGDFGRSAQSRRNWRRYLRDHPWPEVPEALDEVVAFVADYLRPLCAELFRAQYDVIDGLDATAWRAQLPPFPVIEHLDDLDGALGTRDEFQHITRQGYSVVSYRTYSRHTFPNPTQALHPELARHYQLRRECRGLTFAQDGRLISRKLHKFFSPGELPETHPDAIDWSVPATILEKLDGSMIVPVRLDEDAPLLWTTRHGASDIAGQARDFAATHSGDYEGMITALLDEGWVPIFEWCSRQHRIVLDHPESRLVLTAVRHLRTGRYLDLETMFETAHAHGVEVVRALGEVVGAEARAFALGVAEEREGEGYVLRFADDRMLKLKTRRYVLLHRVVTGLHNEPAVWQALLAGELETLAGCLDAYDRPRLERFAAQLDAAIQARIDWLDQYIRDARAAITAQTDDPATARKLLATEHTAELNPAARVLVFDVWKGRTPHDAVMRAITRNISSKKRLARIRPLVDGLRWR